MFRKLAPAGLLLLLGGGLAFWWLTAPERLNSEQLAAVQEGNADAGRRIFFAGGCSACHAAPRAEGDDRFRLGGGVKLVTAFGTFVAPNISQHPADGIGAWSAEDLANAMLKGVSPQGAHYYPAFPYASYARMDPADIGDLHAFLKTLPDVEGRAPESEISFPFSIRRGIGLWKWLHLDDSPVARLDSDVSEAVRLGAYLVEGPGHCGECHTPRDLSGGLDTAQWLAGAAAAEGEGTIPNITAGEGGIGDWSERDIAYFLETGFTPEFDSVGGSMVAVQRNLAELAPEDRNAIAAYLKAIHPLPNGYAAGQ